jgi:hypothetical protein
METIAIIFIGINPLYDRSTCFCAAAKFSSIYQYTDSEWWNCLYIKYSDATSIYNLNIYTRTYPDDVEFYHDKGGPTIGFENFMDALKNGLCGNTDSRLRRAELKETVKVFPLAENGEYYAAIISGEQVFYVNQKGKPEFLDGHARFMQLWLLRNGEWKMARILSYDHGDAKQRLKRSPN